MKKSLGLTVVIIVVAGLLGILLLLFARPGAELSSGGGVTPPPQNGGEAAERPETLDVSLALIALDDGGASGTLVGCGDSVVLISVEIPYTTATLRAALSRLLSIGSTSYGETGLYNALGNSVLEVSEVGIEDGVATISLEGEMSLGGVCDSPRFKAQIEETAKQFESVDSVVIFINDEPIDEVLSEM